MGKICPTKSVFNFCILEEQILCRHENSPEGLYLAYYPFGELIEVQNMPYKIKNYLFDFLLIIVYAIGVAMNTDE